MSDTRETRGELVGDGCGQQHYISLVSEIISQQTAEAGRLPGVYIMTFGCQQNEADSERLAGVAEAMGYVMVESPEKASLIITNTCAVREHAEDRVYSNVGALKKLKARRPSMVLGLLGCIAQKDGRDVLRRAPHLDIVCGTRAFPRIAEFVAAARRGEGPIVATSEDAIEMPERRAAARTCRSHAYVSVLRGCDNFCSYCIVPYVRGREESRPIGEVVEEVRRLVDDGVREVTLLGQNVNAYGRKSEPRTTLAELLAAVDAVPGLARTRFITSHPRYVTPELLRAVRHLRTVCESLHMPAQSGNDRVLRDMRRGYTAQQYRDLLALAREIVPGIAVASDFIVGFPGETDQEFQDTAGLVREARFQNCFVFKYSPRPGTRAARMPDDVAPAEKKRRNIELLAVQERISAEAHQAMIGRVEEVLVEGPSKSNPDVLVGRTRTSHIVHFPGPSSLEGALVLVRITGATPLTLTADITSAAGPPRVRS